MAWLSTNSVTLLNGLSIGILLFTMAVGISIIFGMLQVLNLMHGSMFAVGAYVGYAFTVHATPLGFYIALLVGAASGAILAVVLLPISLRISDHLTQAVITLGLAFIISDCVSSIWGSDAVSVGEPSVLSKSISIGRGAYPVYRLALIGLGLVLAVGVYLALEKTRLGALTRAAVDDREMLGALGVNTSRVILVVAMLGGMLAGIGGVIGGPVLGAYPGMDMSILVLALTVVIIGGLGSILGSFVAAVLVGEAQTLGTVFVPEVAGIITFAVMAIVLAVRPQGLFGKLELVGK